MSHLEARETTLRVRYCFTLSADFIPETILEQDKELRRVVRKSDQCFAFVEDQPSWNVYEVRIAAMPHHLHNDKQSYVISVPFTALPAQMHAITLAAEAIPDELLLEDKELQSAIQRNGKCWACVERQVDWDCYRIRIAAQQNYLHDKERSYVIFVSTMQLQGQEGNPQQIQCHTKKDVLKPAVVQTGKRHLEMVKTHTVCVSKAELLSAVCTMDPLEESAHPKMCEPNLKPARQIQQWIDLLLFRAVLAALKCQDDLQQVIRQALVSRWRFRERLIGIRGMYEEDYQVYWVVQIKIPLCCMS